MPNAPEEELQDSISQLIVLVLRVYLVGQLAQVTPNRAVTPAALVKEADLLINAALDGLPLVQNRIPHGR